MLDARVLRVRLDRSNAVSARVRSTSNSGTNTAISPAVLCAKATGRSVARKLKLVKYWM